MEFIAVAEEIKNNFLAELKLARAGKESSLRFIKHQLPDKSIIKNGELFQVIVIGGSVFRKALLKKENNQISIIDSKTENQPVFTTREQFLSFFTKRLYSNTPIVAINFAYALTPVFTDDMLDGVLISGSKENQFSGLVGLRVGKTIEKYIEQTKQIKISTATANDAICLLLSGIDTYPREALIGAIMGTGTNLSFFNEDRAVNLESENFDKFIPSKECLKIDKNSNQPKTALFEKETAGAYLYKQFNLLLKENNIDYPPLSSTKEISNLALGNRRQNTDSPDLIGNNRGQIADKTDNGNPSVSSVNSAIRPPYSVIGPPTNISDLAMRLLNKSAAYLAAQLAAIAEFKKHDLVIIAEGSLIWENNLYKSFIDEYLRRLSPNYKVALVKIENSSIMGGAKLVA
jgi:hexokinase